MSDKLDGMSDVAGELEQQRQEQRALMEARETELETRIINILRHLERLMQTQPGAHAEGVDRGRAVLEAYKNSMRVVSQTLLGVEPEEVLDHEPPSPSGETKQRVKMSFRDMAKTVGFAPNTMLIPAATITTMERRRDVLLKSGVSKQAIAAVMETAKALGICTMKAPMRWFFSLTSHVIREILWIQQGIDIPEE